MSELTKLSSREELEGWLERSRSQPVWIFKHSLTCPVSAAALQEYEAFAAAGGEETGYGLLEVQTARELSDELARRSGIRHESPQVLRIDNQKVVWHASHWQIREDRLRAAAAHPPPAPR